MRFIVTVQMTKDGKTTDHVIQADDLDDAEVKANKKWKHWTDIRYADIKNARKAHEDS